MIEISNLSFSFKAHNVLENINMKLEEGKIYGLLGENGVGKTTLLTLLCGLKRPKTGYILTDGMAPCDRQPSLLSEQMFLPDEVAPLPLTPLKFAGERACFYPKFSDEAYKALLQEFEIDPAQRMDKMSAGQLKKTWIAYILACNVKYYFMDEPTNGLDIPSKTQFRKAILQYTPENATLVISTHQVRDLESIIDPIIILDSKEVLLNASLEEISAKLVFDYGNAVHPEALYMEQVPGGAIQVYPNINGVESNVNIEALFNTAHLHKEVLKSLFSNK